LDLVSIWIGDHLQTGKPSCYVTGHPKQLSLAIPLWVGAMSTSESWGVNGHTYRPISMVLQCKAGVWLRAEENEMTAAPWAFVALEGLLHIPGVLFRCNVKRKSF